MRIELFTGAEVEQISRVLAEAATGSELTRLFAEAEIADTIGEGATKWKRVAQALIHRQRQDSCGNNVVSFTQSVMRPVRFVGRGDFYEQLRCNLNTILSFKGIEIQESGDLRRIARATTISEAEERAGRLRAELARRKVHPDVLKFCRAELLKENYFHAILEASKSVAQKLRDLTESTLDGSSLADQVFSTSRPLLAWSQLKTKSELSEQAGFTSLLKGMFSMFRNPTAHEPKILKNYTEDEAMDLLTLVSFFHRRIDLAHRTTYTPNS